MKKQEFGKYLYLMIAGFGAISLSILFFFFLFKLDVVGNYLKAAANTLMPFIIGCVMAYLIYPISQAITAYLDKMTGDRFKRVTNSVGIFAGLIIFGIAIYLLLWMLLPQLVDSITSIVIGMPGMVESLSEWIGTILSDNPKLQQAAGVALENSSTQLQNWFTQTLIPKAQEIITSLSASVISVFWFLFDFVIGIIVCIYVLSSVDKLKRQAKMIVRAVAPQKYVDTIFEITYEMDQCFGGFIRGKLVDSLIIGILCFICVSLMDMPYPVLISTIVGVTNIIPFFGPFIGAIPSAILILTVSPIQALYFVIFIFILQQFDGNILGPTILGQSTGLGSIWVLFSILVFGDLFGFVGMIIGVPTFAVIYYLISKYVFKKLKEREMENVVEDYRHRYPDKRVERDAKTVQKNLGKVERLEKWGAFIKKFKRKK
ncbi:MAG: AI-2E family transporter [Lachnospiraceae bacterium]|nr:AI-2E family transporter [Lachnospiraceae bacterium]